MATLYAIFLVPFRLLCLPSDTESAYVVLATVRDQNVIEISQADWAVIFVLLPQLSVNFIWLHWILIKPADVALLIVCADAHLISILHTASVFILDFLKYTLLLSQIFSRQLDFWLI